MTSGVYVRTKVSPKKGKPNLYAKAMWADPNSKFNSPEHSKKVSEGIKKSYNDPESGLNSLERRQKISNAIKLHNQKICPLTDEDKIEIIDLYTVEKLSIDVIKHRVKKGIKRKVKQVLIDAEIELRDKREQASINGRRYWKQLPEDKRNAKINNFIEAGKRRNILPNKSEIKLLQIIDDIFPGEYIYTGHQIRNQMVTIGGIRPDFFNVNSKKKVIELFGEHDHPDDLISKNELEKERKEKYNRFGFDCLIIWSKELNNKSLLTQKIYEFGKDSNHDINISRKDCNAKI